MGHYDSCRPGGNGIDAYEISIVKRGGWPHASPEPEEWWDANYRNNYLKECYGTTLGPKDNWESTPPKPRKKTTRKTKGDLR